MGGDLGSAVVGGLLTSGATWVTVSYQWSRERAESRRDRLVPEVRDLIALLVEVAASPQVSLELQARVLAAFPAVGAMTARDYPALSQQLHPLSDPLRAALTKRPSERPAAIVDASSLLIRWLEDDTPFRRRSKMTRFRGWVAGANGPV